MSHVPNRPWCIRKGKTLSVDVFSCRRRLDEQYGYRFIIWTITSSCSFFFYPLFLPLIHLYSPMCLSKSLLLLPLLLPTVYHHSFIPTHRVSHPGADEREGQDHPRATGLSVSEEGGGEAVLSLLQAFNHLHQRFWGKASSHQGRPALPSA